MGIILINDVNDTVCDKHIWNRDGGIVDHDLPIRDRHGKLLALYSRQGLVLEQCAVRHSAVHDMVGQKIDQLRSCEIASGARYGGKSSIAGGEHGAAGKAVDRVDQVGHGQGANQAGKVEGSSRRVDGLGESQHGVNDVDIAAAEFKVLSIDD